MPLLASAQLIRLDAMAMQTLLQTGNLTSVELVLSVLDQIERNDKKGLKLRAMLKVTPKNLLLEQAKQLDKERQQGIIRSPFHGIPITLKDCIATHPDLGLCTSVGSFALLHSRPAQNASVVDRLIQAGFIILGKANLTEFGNMKSDQFMAGWSPVGGQTRSAYVQQGSLDTIRRTWNSPFGSSTGSAVGVSAGYAPLSIGGEACGSIIQPANVAGLYALKPTIGKIPTDGIWTISSSCDVLGPMAKSANDLEQLYDVLIGGGETLVKSNRSIRIDNLSKLCIGGLDPKTWDFPEHFLRTNPSIQSQIHQSFLEAMRIIERYTAKVIFPIHLPLPDELKMGNQSAITTVFNYEYADNMNHYLQALESSEVRTLQQLVDWNEKHAELELPKEYPDQSLLLRALYARPAPADYETAKTYMCTLYRDQGIDWALNHYKIDLIAVPTTSRICEVAAASGYPLATMPLGTLDYNGAPFGLAVMTTAHREDVLFTFMKAFEAIFPPRPTPKQLDDTFSDEPDP